MSATVRRPSIARKTSNSVSLVGRGWPKTTTNQWLVSREGNGDGIIYGGGILPDSGASSAKPDF